LYKFLKNFSGNPFIKNILKREIGDVALVLAAGLAWKKVFG
jgi:hypothetical protein